MLSKLRAICLGLPEAYEEAAWTGTRWRIRKQTFAHVLIIDDGWPPAYVEAAHTRGPATVVTFRLPIERLEASRFQHRPFFRPVWFRDIVGMFIEPRSDWDEIETLLTASYRRLAPKALAARIEADG